jgi:hypothetical protein
MSPPGAHSNFIWVSNIGTIVFFANIVNKNDNIVADFATPLKVEVRHWPFMCPWQVFLGKM